MPSVTKKTEKQFFFIKKSLKNYKFIIVPVPATIKN